MSPIQTAASPSPKSASHIPELDGLRGVAVLMVLCFHFASFFGEIDGPLRALRTVFTAGWTGVDLFFILSGCLITGILLDEKGTPKYFQRFYTRRALRIFPVYYLALAASFTVARVWLLPPEGVTPLAALAYATNFSNWLSLNQTEIPNLNHYWSLAVEEQFYLCWPLAVFLLNRKALVRLLAAVIVAAPVVRYFILSGSGDIELLKRMASVLTPARADGLAYGALVAIILRESKVREAIVRHAGVVIAAVGLALAAWFGLKGRFRLESPMTLSILYSAIAIAYGLVVLRTASRTGANDPLEKLLRAKPLRIAGRYSYAAYVFHLPVGALIEPDFLNLSPHARQLAAVPWFLGAITITFLLARLSWWMMEAPILKWKDVLAPPPPKRTSEASDSSSGDRALAAHS